MENQKLTKKGQFFDYSTLIIVLVLLAFGLVMVYSTSSYSAALTQGDAAFYLKKQLQATMLGLFCMAVVIFIPCKFFYKTAPIIYLVSLFLVLLVKTPLGRTINGARRWIYVGISIQPAEIVKLAIIIFFAFFISKCGKNMKKMKNNLVYMVLALIPAALILGITKNMSSAIIVGAISVIMLYIANPKPGWMYIVLVVGIAAVAAILAYIFSHTGDTAGAGFRFNRIIAWRNPEAYASGIGYQTLQALYAIGSGGFFGKGLGQSIQKLGFIPEAQNDMIFSVVCEELGLFGGICLIILFVLLIYRFMVIANNASNLFESMIVVGVMAHISIQVILNIAVVTNSIPNTGITLPFISYGGTSVMFLLIEMGLVMNISRNIRVPVSEKITEKVRAHVRTD